MHKRVMIRRRHLTSQAHLCEGEFSGVTCEALAGACPRCIVRVRFPVGSVPAVLSLAVCFAVFYAVDCITFFDGLKTVCDDDESLAAME